MKTIEFKASDGCEYVIPVKSVTYISPNLKEGGSWVSLNNGVKLYTKIEIKTLTKMLKGED